jgi:hypothetical protein
MTIRQRLDKLARRRGAGMVGGVVAVLPDGSYRWQGRTYGPGELPPGGYLLVPGELPPAEWDPLALAVHRGQEQLIVEVGK